MNDSHVGESPQRGGETKGTGTSPGIDSVRETSVGSEPVPFVSLPQREGPSELKRRSWGPWVAIWGLMLVLAAATSAHSLQRYWDFRSGWPWDLAYNNQWFWALVKGDQIITVKPINSWGDEGPWIWNRTHLDPIRLPCAPFYALWPRPESLIIIHNVLLWCLLPAAFGLARSESGSTAVGWLAAGLVPLTPLLGPLLWNDYREMELALPFVLWAIQGIRERRVGLTTFGVIGLLCCREEFGLMVATFAILPPREPEPVGQSFRWSRALFAVGLGWFLFVFFSYEHIFINGAAPENYLASFQGKKPGLIETASNVLDMLAIGVGPWVLLALLAPRTAVLVTPWVLGLCRGRWHLRFLATVNWHHVRYTTPIVALMVAAGVIGFAGLARWAASRKHGRWILGTTWLTAAVGLVVASMACNGRLAHAPQPISRAEARKLWTWIDQVGPDDGVLATYEMTPPLSSRKILYSNVMEQNKPRGYPDLGPEFQWAFLRADDRTAELLKKRQGFVVVYSGAAVRVLHRFPQPSN